MIRFDIFEQIAIAREQRARSAAEELVPVVDDYESRYLHGSIPWARRTAFLAFFIAALFLSWRGSTTSARFLPTARAPHLQPVDVSHSRTGVKLAGRRIDEMKVGQWVLAGNPLGEKDLSIGEKVVPADWRRLKLRAPKKEGGYADVEMLRPLAWLKEQWTLKHLPPLETIIETDEVTGEARLAVHLNDLWRVENGVLALAPIARPVPEFDEKLLIGGMLYVSVPECGIDGDAHVLQIGECPQISPRPGPEFQVVTATFHHYGANIVDVHVESLQGAIGATPNHPFWSEDRQKFLRADELKVGERLRIADGDTRKVTAVSPRASTSDVFNLEVHLDHVYHVASCGVLVHNSVPCTQITLGIGGRNLDELVGHLRQSGTIAPRYRMRGFDRLIPEGSGQLDGVLAVMRNPDVKVIHFNIGDMKEAHFRDWMSDGWHTMSNVRKAEDGGGFTNRELYEVLTDQTLRSKTIFYDGAGNVVGAPNWLSP